MGLGGLFGLGKGSAPSTSTSPDRQPGESLTAYAARKAKLGSSVTAPAPIAVPAMPATTQQSAANAAAAGLVAANKQRKRATTGTIPKPTGTVLSPVVQPKTLLGY